MATRIRRRDHPYGVSAKPTPISGEAAKAIG